MDEINLQAHWFRELMAMLHGDGGHYHSEHGTEKAANDAITKFYRLKNELDKTKHLLESLKRKD